MKRYVQVMAVAIFIAALVSGCAVNPVSGERDFVLMSEDQEISLGRRYNREILEEMPRYDDAALQDYVQRLGARLAANSHRRNLVYRFTVVDSPDVNAFALPGGYIYVTRGILAHLNTEAELAAVLGHEIGHVTARHAVRQHGAATATNILGAVIAARAGFEGAGDIANIVGTAVIRGYGRQQELEADRLGAEYLARSGYDPRAMLRVIGLLKAQEGFDQRLAREEGREPRSYHGVFSTHPDNDQRLQTVVKAAGRLQTGQWRDEREGFLRRLEGLVLGQGREHGVLRGTAFYHDGLGIGLRFPQGWEVENKPDRLIAWSAGRDAWLQVSVQDINRRLTPYQFLQRRLGLKNLQHGKHIRLRGMPGYTGVTETRTPLGRRLTRIVLLFMDDKAYLFYGAARDGVQPYAYDRVFLDTARSLHRLSDGERRKAQPLRLVLRRAKAGWRWADLAGSSPLARHAEARLRLLNGQYPNGEPAPGQLLKLVE